MRQYKFRGKRVDNGQWVYGCLVNNLWVKSELTDKPGQPTCEIIALPDGYYDSWEHIIENYIFEVIPETVGQFTGMQDKNGREIYEWDAVQVYFYDSYKNYTYQFEKAQAWKDGKYHDDIKVVKFFSGSFVIWSDLIQDYRCFANLARPGECLEVIGNIHDNPELIKRTA